MGLNLRFYVSISEGKMQDYNELKLGEKNTRMHFSRDGL